MTPAGLVWSAPAHYDHRGDRPCALCGRPTPLRSHAREPAHKVCAEQWAADHPGTDRFVSDPPAGRRRTHA
ncbi:hypothetical protein [Streptomyces otsuchiensis]|uniref:hypothetical protein n=1 Tax=Streptomyces otsuchiensis TaxID=2681388 RepID=UPI00103174BA|nr:hypothetical protein [Streptomyces otsuchiensis]